VPPASKFAVRGLAETLRLELVPDGISVSVIFPSGMASRHLETSESAQPEHLRRPVGDLDDFEAMMASNPRMAAEGMLHTPEEAAEGVIEAVLARERYVVTHGDFLDALSARHAGPMRAAESSGRT
jgi:NAD(P)-dependent dehydrogenase (short-subunit alcohol dehydrogenase family)